jgi:hypothetical protein
VPTSLDDVPESPSGLYVVEAADGQLWVGEVEEDDEAVFVYSGFRGRPPRLPHHLVESVIPAEEHPDAEWG